MVSDECRCSYLGGLLDERIYENLHCELVGDETTFIHNTLHHLAFFTTL